MNSPKVFLHGVPDTAAMWRPLISHLGLDETNTHAPNLPGFGCDVPKGFKCSKEDYINWFTTYCEQIHEASGPIDVVAHDWGGLIALRTLSLRPELFNSWCLANIAHHIDYKWHRTARIWQTPLLGEVFMLIMTKKLMLRGFSEAGFPDDLAKEEAEALDGRMKSSILPLYRSAKRVMAEWNDEVGNMPKKGIVFWGDADPYVNTRAGEGFAERVGAPFMRQEGVGHWSIVERAEELAKALKELWGG